jgi:predicted transcriptional regulator YheO
LTTGVEKELEAFLLQGKSCLDVLVKILDPVLGIKLHSYGDGGEKVIKALSNNLTEQEVKRAAPLLELMENNKGWISKRILSNFSLQLTRFASSTTRA